MTTKRTSTRQPKHWQYRCGDCGHPIDEHEDGVCRRCQDMLDLTVPGGAQGAHVEPCPSLDGDCDEVF